MLYSISLLPILYIVVCISWCHIPILPLVLPSPHQFVFCICESVSVLLYSFLYVPHIRDNTVFLFLCLIYFTMYDSFQVHTCRCKCQNFYSFLWLSSIPFLHTIEYYIYLVLCGWQYSEAVQSISSIATLPAFEFLISFLTSSVTVNNTSSCFTFIVQSACGNSACSMAVYLTSRKCSINISYCDDL